MKYAVTSPYGVLIVRLWWSFATVNPTPPNITAAMSLIISEIVSTFYFFLLFPFAVSFTSTFAPLLADTLIPIRAMIIAITTEYTKY